MVLILRSKVCDADGGFFEQDKQMEAVECTLLADFLANVHYCLWPLKRPCHFHLVPLIVMDNAGFDVERALFGFFVDDPYIFLLYLGDKAFRLCDCEREAKITAIESDSATWRRPLKSYIQWLSILVKRRVSNPMLLLAAVPLFTTPLSVYVSVPFSFSSSALPFSMPNSPFSTSLACFFGGLMFFHSMQRAPMMEKHDIATATVKVFVRAPL